MQATFPPISSRVEESTAEDESALVLAVEQMIQEGARFGKPLKTLAKITEMLALFAPSTATMHRNKETAIRKAELFRRQHRISSKEELDFLHQTIGDTHPIGRIIQNYYLAHNSGDDDLQAVRATELAVALDRIGHARIALHFLEEALSLDDLPMTYLARCQHYRDVAFRQKKASGALWFLELAMQDAIMATNLEPRGVGEMLQDFIRSDMEAEEEIRDYFETQASDPTISDSDAH